MAADFACICAQGSGCAVEQPLCVSWLRLQSTEELVAGVILGAGCDVVLDGGLALVSFKIWMSCCWMKRVHQLFVATKSSMFCWRAIVSARLMILCRGEMQARPVSG